MKKYFINLSLIFVFFLFMPIINAQEYKDDLVNLNTRIIKNPLWEEYNNLTEEEKANWSEVPLEYITEYVGIGYTPKKFKSSGNVLPSKYDLRNVDGNNYVTSLKNQSSLGLCWAFATNAAIESNLLINNITNKQNEVLLSERQADYATGKPENFLNEGTSPYQYKINILRSKTGYYRNEMGEGANFIYGTGFLNIGVTPATAKGNWQNYNVLRTKKSASDVFSYDNVDYSVTDYVIYPLINRNANDTDREAWQNIIKNHIINYGAAYVGNLAPSTYYSGTCYAQIPNNDTKKYDDLIYWHNGCSYNGTHAMAIIGWDDNYDGSYCITSSGSTTGGTIKNGTVSRITEQECTNNGGIYKKVTGAWILKNSWGSQNSYPYLAYTSAYLEMGGIKKTVAKDWTYNYNQNNEASSTKNGSTIEKVFNKQSDGTEKLVRVSLVHNTSEATTYKIYAKDGSSAYDLVGTVNVDLPGMSSVNISSLNFSSNTFSIKVTSTGTNSVSEITAFSYLNSSNKEISTHIGDELLYDNENYYIKYSIYPKNVNLEDSIEYRFYNENDEKIQNLFSVIDGSLTSSFVDAKIKLLSNNITNGKYKIKILVNGEVLNTNTFTIGKYLTGSGTQNDPYLVNSIYALDEINSSDYFLKNKYYKLTQDLDLSRFFVDGADFDNGGSGWRPIGSDQNEFEGVFDGNNHKIINLRLTSEDEYTALFGAVKNSTIKNLGLINTYSSAPKSASLVGIYKTNSIIDNCFAVNSKFIKTSGGIVAKLVANNLLESGKITNCFATGKYVSNNDAGIILDSNYSVISNCWYNFNSGTTNSYKIYDSEGSIKNTTLDGLKDSNNFSDFDFTNYWKFENENVYPTLKSNPYYFISKINIDKTNFINDTLHLKVGNKKTINYSIVPQNAYDKSLTFSVKGENVTVNNAGEITGVNIGSDEVIINTLDGGNYSETVKVNVFENFIEPSSFTVVNDNIYDKQSFELNASVIVNDAKNNQELKISIKDSNGDRVNSSLLKTTGNYVNNGIANINVKVVNGLPKGNYTLFINYAEKSYGINIPFEVKEFTHINKISLDKKNISMLVGTTETLTVSYDPENASNKDVTWTSSNEEYATVEDGVITAKKNGNVIITATSADGSKVSSCNVTIEDKSLIAKDIIYIGDDSTNDVDHIYDSFLGTVKLPLESKFLSNSYDIKIFDNYQNDITSKFEISGNDIVDNKATISAKLKESLEAGTYIIKYSHSDYEDKTWFSKIFEIKEPVLITSISSDDIYILFGEDEPIEVSYLPNEVTCSMFEYISNDEEIVTVNDDGLVTAVGIGNTTIKINTLDGSNKTITINVTVEGNLLPNTPYDLIDDNIVCSINPINVSLYLNSVGNVSGSVVKIYDSKNIEVVGTNNVGTGMKLKTTKNSISRVYNIVIMGDTTGDGKINYLDYVNVYNHIQKIKHPELSKKLLLNEFLIAAELSGDGKINYLDYVKIYQKIKELKGGN